MSKTFFRLPTWAQIWFLLPGQEAQMVETNWGEGQSLYVLLKSRGSPEVEGAIAVAQASSGWWERWQPSPGLPAHRDAKLNACSSRLPRLSLDKFLHPSIWLGQQNCVCVHGGVL